MECHSDDPESLVGTSGIKHRMAAAHWFARQDAADHVGIDVGAAVPVHVRTMARGACN